MVISLVFQTVKSLAVFLPRLVVNNRFELHFGKHLLEKLELPGSFFQTNLIFWNWMKLNELTINLEVGAVLFHRHKFFELLGIGHRFHSLFRLEKRWNIVRLIPIKALPGHVRIRRSLHESFLDRIPDADVLITTLEKLNVI